MVVDAGEWLPGRKVLIHPSAVAAVPSAGKAGAADVQHGRRVADGSGGLTRRQIEAAPAAPPDAPVTEALEARLSTITAWTRCASAPGLGGEPAILRPAARDSRRSAAEDADGGARLGSAAALKGFSVAAADGPAGSLDAAIVDVARAGASASSSSRRAAGLPASWCGSPLPSRSPHGTRARRGSI